MTEEQEKKREEASYLPTVVAPSVAGEIMRLDTPQNVQDDKWEHNTKDLPLANFNEIDINVMKGYVDMSFLEDFRGSKISDWDSQKVEKREDRRIWIGICPECGFMTRNMELMEAKCPTCQQSGKENKLANGGADVSTVTALTEKWKLWGKDKSMVFILSTNARNGFRFKGLTEQHGYMQQDIRQTPLPSTEEPKKKRKRFVLF